jgi:DNA-binding NarL/FixJ family response regulator
MNERAALRVLVVEDDWMVAHVADEIVNQPQRVIAAFERVRPDLVVLDIELGRDHDGIELAAALRRHSPVPIVFLSAHSDLPTVKRALSAAPQGFVVKPFTSEQLLAAVEIAVHTNAVRPEVAARRTLEKIAALLSEHGRPRPALVTSDHPLLRRLSSREREIVRELLGHRRVPGIAKALDISEHTVRNHLKSIFAKLHVHSQSELLDLITRNDGGHDEA